MPRILKGPLAIAALAIVAVDAKAAFISVQPSIGGYFDTAFNPIPPPSPTYRPGTYNTGFPTVVQVDIHMTVESLAPGEDSFGHAAFTIKHGGWYPLYGGQIHPNLDAGGYSGYTYPNVDTNGPLPPGANIPIYAQNADLGVSSVDLVGILVQMAVGPFTNPFDPRRDIGEPTGVTLPSGDSLAGPVLVGSAYLTWNGAGPVYLTLEGSLPGTPPEVSAKRTDGLFVPGTAAPAAVIYIGTPFVPEPSSLVLLGGCLAGVVLRRR